MFGINSTTIQASIDNRTKHSMSLDIAKAEPVHKAQLDKLIEQVGMNFSNNAHIVKYSLRYNLVQ